MNEDDKVINLIVKELDKIGTGETKNQIVVNGIFASALLIILRLLAGPLPK